MRKKLIILCALFLSSCVVTALIIAPNVLRNNEAKSESENAEMKKEEKTAPEPQPAPVDLVKEKLDTMTLDEKIAQLLIVENKGMTVSEAEIKRLKETPYGGYQPPLRTGSLRGTESLPLP